jgi:hypothetical protein
MDLEALYLAGEEAETHTVGKPEFSVLRSS